MIIGKDDLITLLMNDKPEQSPAITSLSQEIQDQVNNLGDCDSYFLMKQILMKCLILIFLLFCLFSTRKLCVNI